MHPLNCARHGLGLTAVRGDLTRDALMRIRQLCCASLAALAGFLSACSTQRVKLDHPAPSTEYSGEVRSGSAALTGEAFSTTKAGDVKLGAGRLVHLDPVTSYSTELFEKLVEKRRALLAHDFPTTPEHEQDTVEIDPLMLRYRRNALVNSTGRFAFANLPAGEYYVSCYINWMASNGFWTGGWRLRKVSLAEGEKKFVVLQ